MSEEKSNCANHKRDIAGITDMKQLAEMIGDLHYETLSKLLHHLSDKLWKDHVKDANKGRINIAGELNDASMCIDEAYRFIEKAWQISKPFMEIPTP